MSFDVNKYRNANETEKEWQLKRLFIERFHTKFDEDRLLCLAQCYVNIETMGCRYSKEIMKQITELTADFQPIVKERIDQVMKERKPARPLTKNNRQPQQMQNKNNSNDKRRPVQQSTRPNEAPRKKELNGQQAQQPNRIQILSRDSNKPATEPAKAKPTAAAVLQKSSPKTPSVPVTPNNSLASLNSNSRNGMDFITFIKANMAPAAPLPTLNSSNNASSPSIAKNKSYLLGKLGNSSSSANTSLSVPNTTTELAPAPSLVPIPTELASAIRFDLGVAESRPIQVPGSPSTQRNLLSTSSDAESNRLSGLLESLSASLPSAKKDPFAMLVSSVNAAGPVLNSLASAPANSQPVAIDDSKFKKLNKINKLREFLRKDFPKQRSKLNSYKPPAAAAKNATAAAQNQQEQNQNENNLINYLRESCDKFGVRLNYVQYHQAEENTYFGELYLESLRFMSSWDKKRKRCCYFAHKKALNLLASQCELAVKHVQKSAAAAEAEKRKKLKKMDSSATADEIQDFDDSYELYQIDGGGGGGGGGDTSANEPTNGRNILNELIKPAAKVAVESNPNEDLNAMLKSMLIRGGSSKIRPPVAASNTAPIQDEAILATSTPATSAAIIKPAVAEKEKENESMALDNSNESKEDGQEDDDADDDEDNTKQGSTDRRTRVKAALGGQFCLFLPSDIGQTTDISAIFQEKNAINILTNSTAKSNCRLEFEIKTKIKAEQNQSTKSLMSGDRLHSESDEENTDDGVKRKYKCKIIINGVKVVSAHSKNRVDAKRQASLKACKYLAKFCPLIKEQSYSAYTSSSSSTNVFKSDENQQPAESTSRPHDSTAPAAASANMRYFKIPKEALFSTAATTTLLPPTSFESSSSSNILNILTIKNNNSLPSAPAILGTAGGGASSMPPIYSQFGSN